MYDQCTFGWHQVKSGAVVWLVHAPALAQKVERLDAGNTSAMLAGSARGGALMPAYYGLSLIHV